MMTGIGARVHAEFARILDSLIRRIPDVLVAITLLVVFLLLAWLVKRVLRAAFQRTDIDRDVAALLTRLAGITVAVVGVFEALGLLNVNLEALGLGVGLLGVAVGLALKDVLSNFLAGILILLTRPFVSGDQIRIKEYEGTIEAVQLRGTVLKTYDGQRVIIPNADVYTNPVTNHTAHSYRRSSILVTVGSGSDMDQVEAIIRAALRSVPGVSEAPEPDVLVKELADFGIKYEIRIWSPPRQIEVVTINSAATKAVKAALEANGIQMPFPTHVVILHREETDKERGES